jgi:hypothetical protein
MVIIKKNISEALKRAEDHINAMIYVCDFFYVEFACKFYKFKRKFSTIDSSSRKINLSRTHIFFPLNFLIVSLSLSFWFYSSYSYFSSMPENIFIVEFKVTRHIVRREREREFK